MFEAGLGVLGVGIVLAVLGVLLNLASRSAINQPPRYDGIGGRDTDNLMVGCLGTLIGWVFYLTAAVLVVVGGVLTCVGYFVFGGFHGS